MIISDNRRVITEAEALGTVVMGFAKSRNRQNRREPSLYFAAFQAVNFLKKIVDIQHKS